MDTISSVIRSFSAGLVSFLAVLALSGCSDPEPELNTQQILSEIEGTQLTEAEAAILIETADLLCSMNKEALESLLAGVETERLNYLDWVFGDHCEERQALYDSVLEQSFPEHVEKANS